MKNKIILITGASGYLGKQLCLKLAKENRLVVLKRQPQKLAYLPESSVTYYDSTDASVFKRLFVENKIDAIINCATNYNTDLGTAIDSAEANLMFPLRLAEVAYSVTNKPLFINIGTILEPSISIYAMSKKHFTDWLQLFSKAMPCVNVALSQFYGPFDNVERFSSMIIRSLLNDVEKIDLSPGEQKRDFIHIADVVDAIVLIAENHSASPPAYYTYDIGTRTQTTLKEFILEAKKIIGNTTTQLNFGAKPYRANEVLEYHLNLEPIFALGWKPQFNLTTGLLDTITYEAAHLVQERA
jgi:CDP-paratose synthetase